MKTTRQQCLPGLSPLPLLLTFGESVGSIGHRLEESNQKKKIKGKLLYQLFAIFWMIVIFKTLVSAKFYLERIKFGHIRLTSIQTVCAIDPASNHPACCSVASFFRVQIWSDNTYCTTLLPGLKEMMPSKPQYQATQSRCPVNLFLTRHCDSKK